MSRRSFADALLMRGVQLGTSYWRAASWRASLACKLGSLGCKRIPRVDTRGGEGPASVARAAAGRSGDELHADARHPGAKHPDALHAEGRSGDDDLRRVWAHFEALIAGLLTGRGPAKTVEK